MPSGGPPWRTYIKAQENIIKLTRRIFVVAHSRVEGEGCRSQQGKGPQRCHDPQRPPEAGHGVQVQRVADGQVSLQRESHDGQHGDVRCPVEDVEIIY